MLILMGFFLFVVFLIDRKPKGETQESAIEQMASVDTYIPPGYVLVDIIIQNLAFVDSIVGQFAVVDVLTAADKTPVGQGLKLIRSPNNPSQFGVLVPESSSHLFTHDKPFYVAIQNPKQNDTSFKKPTKPKRILWED